jgi:hypothetical protein
MASLFSGVPVNAPSYSKSTTETPQWMQDAIYNQVQWAQNLAATPYQTYGLPTVAELSPLQQQSIDTIQADVGTWKPALASAQAGTQNLSGATSVGNVSQYLSPYTTAVTDQIAKLGARNLSEKFLPEVSDAFIRAGQFGSSRMGDFGARALRDVGENVLGQQSSTLQSGYAQALGAAQADLVRQQSALGQMSDLATKQQQMGLADTGALSAAGQQMQQQKQAELSAAQQQYEKELLYPKQQMDWLSTQIRGMSPITPQTTTTHGYKTEFGPSPLSQFASVFATGAGLKKLA